MSLTPLDIQNKEFRKSLWGYNDTEVDTFLEKVLENFEKIYRENAELKEELEKYKSKINDYERMEETIKETMMLAKQTAEEVKENANKEADLIKREAQNQAEKMKCDMQREIEHLQQEYERLRRDNEAYRARMRSFLQTQLEMLEGKEEGEEEHVQDSESPHSTKTEKNEEETEIFQVT